MKFINAQTKMIKYLKSLDFSNRSDTQDTIISLPILEKIITNGFISDGSQEGIHNRGYNTETKRYYKIKERAFLTGFMKRAKARKFVERINTETNKIAFIVQIDPSEAFDKLFYEGDPNAVSSIPVTVENSASIKSKIKSLYPHSQIKLVLPKSTFNCMKKSANLKKICAIEYIACIDPVYCRRANSVNGLYKDVLKTLVNL
jgi:hypothetical protein